MLVTGPTGSGKTTTLYSALSEMNDVGVKIITTEDPVEYDIDGLVQVPINADIGVTFASTLRSILRQDPDIILVGEIRDFETAKIAVQAALTGHLVFSTLHTNDAPGAVTRMRDMGVPPFLLTATLQGILAQRLVRKICVDCREEFTPSPEMLMELALTREKVKGRTFYHGRGCERCNNTGHKGRCGIYELLRDQRRDPRVGHRGRLQGSARRRRPPQRHDHPARGGPESDFRGHDQHRRNSARNRARGRLLNGAIGMPTFQYEAMDNTGAEIKDSVEAPTAEEAHATIRQMGYFVTKIAEKGRKRKKPGAKRSTGKRKKTFSIGGVSSKQLCVFTRQLSTLQDAGLPVLRSLKILEGQAKPGPLKNVLGDVIEDIESGLALSEALAKYPRTFDKLYVNMVKAGEAGGALEVILQRLADFKEKAQSLKRRVLGAMIYPIVVILVSGGILFFILK